jgi:hypothetical protein
MKFFLQLVTLDFSFQRICCSWIGEFLSLVVSSITSITSSPASAFLSDLRPANPILKFAQRMFLPFLTTAAIQGIIAATRTTSSGPANTADAKALRIASVTIFLFLTVVQALQTGILATAAISGNTGIDYSRLFAE